jgi:hypothetical protein
VRASQAEYIRSAYVTVSMEWYYCYANFTAIMQQKKQLLLNAVMRGENTHVREQLLREYSAHISIAKGASPIPDTMHFWKIYFAKITRC